MSGSTRPIKTLPNNAVVDVKQNSVELGKSFIASAPPTSSKPVPIKQYEVKVAPQVSQSSKAVNTITIDGVTMPRQPSQQNMATYYSDEQATRLLKNIPSTVYVPDNYRNNDILVGYNASGDAISTSHGVDASSTANFIFKGKAKIEQLDISSADGRGYDLNKLLKSFELIIQKEAKLQNKSVDKVDLSHVAVNLSLGADEMALPVFVQAIKAITDRGGRVYQSAGNDKYNKHASVYKNITVVDATDDAIGGTISPIAKCSTELTNLCEDPDKRNIDSSSSNIKAPQRLITRVGKDGGIEIKDKNSPTGWTRFIDKSDTEVNKLEPIKGFDGSKPSAIVTLKQLNELNVFRNNLITKNQKNLNDQKIINKMDLELVAEAKRRFGDKAIIPIELYGLYQGWSLSPGSENKLSVTLPSGVSKENIFVPLDRTILKTKNIGTLDQPLYSQHNLESAEIPYFTLDKNGKMKFISPENTVMNNGTSWATPYALAETELGYRVQVEKARSTTKH